MRLKFPLHDPRPTNEACATPDEYAQRVAYYMAPMLHAVEQMLKSDTLPNVAERFQYDDEARRDMQCAVASIFLVLDRGRVAQRRADTEQDAAFQSFMAKATSEADTRKKRKSRRPR
jgi:hypothetical protein